MIAYTIRKYIAWKNQTNQTPRVIQFAIYLSLGQLSLEFLCDLLHLGGWGIYNSPVTFGFLVVAGVSLSAKLFFISALSMKRRAMVNLFLTYSLIYWGLEGYYRLMPEGLFMMTGPSLDWVAVFNISYVADMVSLITCLSVCCCCYLNKEAHTWLQESDTLFHKVISYFTAVFRGVRTHIKQSPASIRYALSLMAVKAMLWWVHDTSIFIQEVWLDKDFNTIGSLIAAAITGSVVVISVDCILKTYLFREILRARRGMRDLYMFFYAGYWLILVTESYGILTTYSATQVWQGLQSSFGLNSVLLGVELMAGPLLVYFLYWHIDSQVWFSPYRQNLERRQALSVS